MKRDNTSTATDKRMLSFVLQLLSKFIIFLLILIVIGLALHDKMTDSLNREVEKFNTTHGELISFYYYNLLTTDLDNMSNISGMITAGNISPANGALAIGGKGQLVGILDIHGNNFLGDTLPPETRIQCTRALQGEKGWKYYTDLGLVGMVPIYDGDNVRYVLYKVYTPEALQDINSPFHFSDKRDDEENLLYDKSTQQVVVPFTGYKESEFYDHDKDAPLGLNELLEKLGSKNEISIFNSKLSRDYLLYAASIPDSDFMIIGYREWRSVLTGITNIHLIIIWVFGLLVVLFCVFILYLFTNQVAAEESTALREARDDALRANEAKSEFLANMSHEIRTPLNAILGMNEMIMREATGSLKKYAFNVKSAGETLLSIINDILDFSKIESGKMEIVTASYSLSSVLNDVYNMVSYKASQKDLAFHMEVDPQIPDSLSGDEVRLRQVIVNILNNAVKYTQKGSVTFIVKARKHSEDELLELEFITRDTGIGIRDEDKDKLFSKFQRLDLEKNRTIEGTGLGLAITIRLTEMMHGSIAVDSVYGEGSTFTLKIPQVVEKNEPIGDFNSRIEAALKKDTYTESFTAPQANILVVDDNEMNLTVVESLLEKTRINIHTAKSGQECLEMIQDNYYDIVFLDHMMPEMDGLETLERAKHLVNSKCKNTPFIALTANAVAGVKEMFLSKGFVDYVSKPVDGKTLERIIQKHLPPEKIKIPAVGTAEQAHKQSPPAAPEASDTTDQQIDLPTAMKFCGGTDELQRRFLGMFVSRREAVCKQLDNDLQSGKIDDYTIHVHALKSTALSIGGVKLSECAKELEFAGNGYCNGTEAEKEEHLQYIREHHPQAVELYARLANEARERFGVE
ncbi:MAG: response regulator [Anaerovibrio sp.]|uniref:ATP-binding protein n=1 Tax=Anaerovibrio sp. TaxID=1872532 RepID=UPI0025FCD0CB|nr:ATP-binding protein [Anaerovibrio sp.]MCR5175524.1 response regulator [Anaerovibrio sp.]